MAPSSSDGSELLAAVTEMNVGLAGLRKEVATTKVAVKHNRRMIRLMGLSVAIDVALSLGLGYAVHQSQNASNKASKASSTAVVTCRAANVGNDIQRKLWDTVLAFPPPDKETAAAKADREARSAGFKAYLDTAFAQRDCTRS
jgi:hypothetical protein